MEKHLVILSGAGMSAESGIQTFRDAAGLWEGHDVMEVASPEGWKNNKDLVLDFYNQRRRQLLTVNPNEGHRLLATLQNHYKVSIITQNVDDLHERAGSQEVLHLHGELLKVRSVEDESLVQTWTTDLYQTDTNAFGHHLRPHIVWFGEMVPELERAISIVKTADILIIIGTSLQVYPAASLIHDAPEDSTVYYIDPKPAESARSNKKIQIIPLSASQGVRQLFDKLILESGSL